MKIWFYQTDKIRIATLKDLETHETSSFTVVIRLLSSRLIKPHFHVPTKLIFPFTKKDCSFGAPLNAHQTDVWFVRYIFHVFNQGMLLLGSNHSLTSYVCSQSMQQME